MHIYFFNSVEKPHERKIKSSTKGILGGNKREERVKSIDLLPEKDNTS